MVGQWPLKPSIMVRIHVPELVKKSAFWRFFDASEGEAKCLRTSRQGFESRSDIRPGRIARPGRGA